MTKNTSEKIEYLKAQRQRVFHDWLYVSYPNVFNAQKPLPLTKGIANMLAGQLPENVTVADLKSAMGWYCRRMLYLYALIEKSHRVDLNGNPVEEVMPDEKIAAKELLKKYKEQQKHPEKPKDNTPMQTASESTNESTSTESQVPVETKPKTLTLKRKSVESSPQTPQTPVKPAPVSSTGGIAIAKGLKVTLVVEPASIPVIDSVGMKKVPLTLQIANTDIQATTELSAKSYRKALSSIEEYGVDGCNAILQGSMKQYGVIDEAGLVIQPKKQKTADNEVAAE